MFEQSRRRGRQQLALAGVVAATGLALLLPGPLGPGPAGAGGFLPLDHFQCWVTEFNQSPVAQIRINDGRVGTKAQVKQPTMLCAPVKKQVVGAPPASNILNPEDHLVIYRITPEETGQFSVSGCNQFGCFDLLFEGPTRLLVPTRKFPHEQPQGLDHYQCYEVTDFTGTGANPDTDVVLTDQFKARGRQTIVQAAQLLCSPARKVHRGRTFDRFNTFQHLVCYDTSPKLARKRPAKRDIVNQFVDDRVKVRSAHLLCVPKEDE